MRTSVRTALAALVVLLLPALPATPTAMALGEETTDAVVTLVSPEPGSTVGGAFTARFQVDLGDQEQTEVSAGWGRSVGTRSVTRETCPTGCTVDIAVEPGRDFERPVSGDSNPFFAGFTTPGGYQAVGVALDYRLPALEHSLTRQTAPTPNTAGYSAAVADTTVTYVAAPVRTPLLPDGGTPLPGETVEARLVRGSAGVPDLGAELERRLVEWVSTPAGYRATMTFDLSGYPEGSYFVVTRGRSADGWYVRPPFDTGEIVVRHAPPLALEDLSQPDLVGTGRTMYVSLRGPLARSVGYVEVSVDGVVTNPGDANQSWPASLTSASGSAQRLVGLGTFGVGRHAVSARMLESTTRPNQVGVPVTTTYDVVTLGIRVVAPPAFVGRASQVTATADAPAGHVIESLSGQLTDPSGWAPSGSWCAPCGGQHGTGRTSFTPRAAGSASYVVWADAGDWFQQSVSGSFPVYANRRVASFAAPATRYGSTQKVTVRLADDRGAGVTSLPVGVPVTLQLRKAGTTTWVSVASARATTGGVATLAYTSRANGQLRVSYATPAPGVGWLSGVVPATSTAAVTVTSTPTYTYRNRSVVVKASTYPYQAGATVSLQTRLRGTSTWRTVRTVAAPAGGTAQLTTAFGTRGTYEVRVLRSATSLNGSGVSAVRVIAVR
ncbi:hypothetical protein [Intrasporangium sp. YIM S08009]|uniref:hypothetical protein n=1 Tax=Intrasporangium zincisolvens TaxID=3080018 RepID=UPI002B062738|nr:hypothetical protein [Intrasporangium sp. YIM S08009]